MVRVGASGRRRSRQEAEQVRQALAQGYRVEFDNPDQWRYYQRTLQQQRE